MPPLEVILSVSGDLSFELARESARVMVRCGQSCIGTTCTSREAHAILCFAEQARSRLRDDDDDDEAYSDDENLRLWQLNLILSFYDRPTAPTTPRDAHLMDLFRERDALAAAQ